MTVAAWQITAQAKQQEFAADVQATGFPTPTVKDDVLDVSSLPLDKYLSAKQIKITESGPEVLVDALASGAYTSVEVTEAFCRRAIIAHKLINCLNVIFFDYAMTRAKALDDYRASTGKTVGPLHGLPISLKNQCEVKGIEMNLDYVGWSGRIAADSCVMVKLLEKQGAVHYCLTNMSQALYSSDSVNNLYGRTLNPFNRKLAVGGSSGGEGGLIALRGSALGVGSDLGGSVRLPAGWNGLYGFRGSWNRMPYGGASNSQLGQETIPSVLGPLSTTVDGLKLFFKAVLDAKPWSLDPMALRMPWNEESYQLTEHGDGKGPLCFAFQWDDGVVKPNPPYYRAMQIAKDALVAKGHTVIDWTLPFAKEQGNLLLATFTSDGGVDVADNCALSGEPVIGGALKGMEMKHLTTREYHAHTYQCRQSTTRFYEAWRATAELTGTGRPFDAVITPISPYPSFVPVKAQYIFYTAVANFNDLPGSTFPVTKVDPVVDKQVEPWSFRCDADKDVYHQYDDPEVFRGMPVGLQLFGQRGEDEAVLKMTEIVVAALAEAS